VKKVLVYKSDLLPYSETFIREQVRSYSRWAAVLVGTHVVRGVPLDGLDVRLLHRGGGAPNWLGMRFREVLRELDVASPGDVQQLRREAASLFHVHFGTEAVAVWPLAKRLRLPVVVTLHGSDINLEPEWWRRPEAGYAARRYPDRLLALGKDPRVHFVAVGQAVEQRAIAYGLPAERISVRYIGVDVDRFRFSGRRVSERPRRVLFTGRMIESKGVSVLIDAFVHIRRALPDAELVLIGDGPLRKSLEQKARDVNLPVTFLGQQPHDQVAAQLQVARVFCLPSVTASDGTSEGMPISLLEAQACGVPVVTSARGGVAEGVDPGVTGFTFGEGDVPALANALTRVLQDDDLAERMSSSGPRFVRERFDIRVCTGALEELYDELVSSYRRGATR
jgi:glycosyltransferase involved in cell wall biosynthesis